MQRELTEDPTPGIVAVGGKRLWVMPPAPSCPWHITAYEMPGGGLELVLYRPIDPPGPLQMHPPEERGLRFMHFRQLAPR